MTTYKELIENIKEIHIVNNIINDIKESIKLDKWENIIRKNNYNWYDISAKEELTEEFIIYYKEHVKWILICNFQNLSEEFIKEYVYIRNWFMLKNNSNISSELYKKLMKLLEKIIL